MTFDPKPPTFLKRTHHIVPVGWQKHFLSKSSAGGLEGYYKNIRSGKVVGPVGPGEKMSEELVNIVFDKFFRPSDQLEDFLGERESRLLPTISVIQGSEELTFENRANLAMLFALQTLRYPEDFDRKLDLGRYYAMALEDCTKFENARAFNLRLAELNMPASVFLDELSFQKLKSSPAENSRIVDELTKSYGYEALFNKSEVIKSEEELAARLICFRWTLLKSASDDLILCDRPVPFKFPSTGFRVAISSRFAVKLDGAASDQDILPESAMLLNGSAVADINSEARRNAKQWICGRTSESVKDL